MLTRILLDTLVGVPEAAMAIATTSRGVNTCKTVSYIYTCGQKYKYKPQLVLVRKSL